MPRSSLRARGPLGRWLLGALHASVITKDQALITKKNSISKFGGLVKSPNYPVLSFLRKQESRVSRENGNPVPLYSSLLSQGQRLDSGFRRSDGFRTFYGFIKIGIRNLTPSPFPSPRWGEGGGEGKFSKF